jgi:hypothetical protein
MQQLAADSFVPLAQEAREHSVQAVGRRGKL